MLVGQVIPLFIFLVAVAFVAAFWSYTRSHSLEPSGAWVRKHGALLVAILALAAFVLGALAIYALIELGF